MTQHKRADLSRVKTISIATRKSKVTSRAFAKPFPARGDSFIAFVDGLPDILLARDLRLLVDDLVNAQRKRKQVILMMGAHVIKVGLSPVVVDLLRRGVITAVAMNSAAAIHDVETALWGRTSEDVAANLSDGRFGMARETGEFINHTLVDAARDTDLGYGEALGARLRSVRAPNARISLLAHVPQTPHPRHRPRRHRHGHHPPAAVHERRGHRRDVVPRFSHALCCMRQTHQRQRGPECRKRRHHAGGLPESAHRGKKSRRPGPRVHRPRCST